MAVNGNLIPKDAALNFDGEPVKIIVGSDAPTPFYVHEEVLRSSSDFFDKALSCDWIKATERVVKLPEDFPHIFRLYVHWLYRGTIPCAAGTSGTISDRNDYARLVRAYVLGDKLQDGGFCDVAIDGIISRMRSRNADTKMRQFPGLDSAAAKFIYDNTQQSSLARRVFAVFYAFHAKKYWVTGDANREYLWKDFLLDVTAVLLDKSSYSDPIDPTTDTCVFHQHGSDPCYKVQHNRKKRVKKA